MKRKKEAKKESIGMGCAHNVFSRCKALKTAGLGMGCAHVFFISGFFRHVYQSIFPIK